MGAYGMRDVVTVVVYNHNDVDLASLRISGTALSTSVAKVDKISSLSVLRGNLYFTN